MPLPLLPLVILVAAQPPFAVDRKPMPRGEDWGRLLPVQVGPYRRENLKPPTRDQDGQARYTGLGQSFFLLFGKARDAKDLGAILATVEKESRALPGQLLEEKIDLKASTPFLLRVERRGVFFAWARGVYYFSVETEARKPELQSFLNQFPY